VSFPRAQLARIVLLVVLATQCGSALAWAQARAPLTAPAAPPKGAPTWHFNLSAGGSWYSNPFFVGAAPGTTWGTTGRATLSHEHSFRTGQFTWSANGGAFYYPEVEDLNQPTYGGAVNLLWNPGRRSKLTLRQDYQRSSTRDVTSLDVEGLPLPTSALDSATSTLTFDQKLSQRWQLSVGGHFLYRRYDDPRLYGGEEAGGNALIGTRAGRNGLAFMDYQYTASSIRGSALRSHQGLVGYGRRPALGFAFEIAAGVGYVDTVKEFYPSGRAGFASRGRKASIEGHYERSFGQAFGYGRPAIADLFRVTGTWMPVRRVTVSADYNFGYRREPGLEGNTINSWIASGGFNWDMGGGVDFTARYAKERNDTYNANVPVMGDTVSASLSYGVDWR
jgi:hypothetical protein